MTEAEKAGKIIKTYLKTHGLAHAPDDAELKAWSEVVEPKINRRSRAIRLHRGVLFVEVQSAALLQELVGFKNKELLKKIQSAIPHKTVREIRFLPAG